MDWRYCNTRWAWFGIGCSIAGCRDHVGVTATTEAAGLSSGMSVSAAAPSGAVGVATAASASTAPTPVPVVNAERSKVDASLGAKRTIHFAWRPPLAAEREYAMPEPQDQHRIILSKGVEHGGAYPVVVAMHGQPRRGQPPRRYAFLREVAEVSRELAADGHVSPHVLVTPVFRFEGQNWPHFALRIFISRVEELLSEQGIRADGIYLLGHSGAAGCGGEGLNDAANASPKAVGFFDTCLGAGFMQAVAKLQERAIPTLILHSVETAGFHPRQPVEYDAHFDFGKVYSRLGLRPDECPSRLPEVPLRALAFRCAKNQASTTRALVLDTGVGAKAHDAIVKVGMRYFLREYLPRVSARVPRNAVEE